MINNISKTFLIISQQLTFKNLNAVNYRIIIPLQQLFSQQVLSKKIFKRNGKYLIW
jgi:hypothetical protein